MILGEGVAGFEEEGEGGIGMSIEGAIGTLMGGIVLLIAVLAITATTTTVAVVITRIGIGIGIGTGMGCLGIGGVDLEVPLREGMEGLRLVRLSCPLVPAIEVA